MAGVNVLIKAFKKAVAEGDSALANKISAKLKKKGVDTSSLRQGPSELKESDFGDWGSKSDTPLEDLKYGPKDPDSEFGDAAYKGLGPDQSLDDLRYGPKEQGFDTAGYEGQGPFPDDEYFKYGPHKQDPSGMSARQKAGLAGAGLAGTGAGGFAYNYNDSPEENEEKFLQETSIASTLANKLGKEDPTVTPLEEEDTGPERPSVPGLEPEVRRTDIEPEIDEVRRSELDSIKSQRSEAQKRIATKKLLSKLIDAAGLAYGASQGVTADIDSGDIDTSMDEYNMRQDEQSAREMLRDRIRQMRAANQQRYSDDTRSANSRYSHKMRVYQDKLSQYDEAIRKADKEEAAKLKEAKKAVEEDIKKLDRSKKEAAKLSKEAVSIGKAFGKAWKDYQEDGDKEDFFKQLEFNGIELTDEEKENIIKEDDSILSWIPFVGDDPKLMAGVPLFRRKARERIGQEIEERGREAVYNSPSTIKIQAPNGDILPVPAHKKDYYISKGGKLVE